MKKLLRVFVLMLCSIIIAPFCACSKNLNEYVFYAFNNTPVIVTADVSLSHEQKNEITTYLSELNNEFSVNKNSFARRLNECETDSETLSSRAVDVFNACKNLFAFTNGKFNPAVFPLVELWQFAPSYPVQNFTPPTQDEINEILTSNVITFDNFILTENVLTKTNANAKMDFGGALKGYASDKIAELLTSYGATKGYVSIGSSSLNILNMNAVSVKHPRNDGLILKINLEEDKNYAISTSGDYERYYEFDGIRYSHILDGTMGKPAQTNIVSATIIGNNGLVCDALSTALCLCEYDLEKASESELFSLINKILSSTDYSSAQIFAVYDDGENKLIITNKKQGEDFTLLDTNYVVVNI